MANLADKTCASVEWYTPPEVLERVRSLFNSMGGPPGFLDPCTPAHNPTEAEFYLSLESGDDGLRDSWNVHAKEPTKVFCNPPYGKALYDWIARVVAQAEAGHHIVLLVSASSRWDQAGWQEIFSRFLTAFWMPRGRVKFIDADGVQQKSPTYPSLLFFYNISPRLVRRAFSDGGRVVSLNSWI